MNKKIIILLTSVFIALIGANQAQAISAKDIDQVIVFGDSLSDAGVQNANPTNVQIKKKPIYTSPAADASEELAGTWPQFMTTQLEQQGSTAQLPTMNNQIFAGLKVKLKSASNPTPLAYVNVLPEDNGTNYAAGGATTDEAGMSDDPTTYVSPSVQQQINFYLANHNPNTDPNAVYFVWAGSNNILKALGDDAKAMIASGSFNQQKVTTDLITAAIQAAKDEAAEVAQLKAAGAKRIVVIDVPHIGDTPLVAMDAQLMKAFKVPNAPTAAELKMQLNAVVEANINTMLPLLPQDGSVLVINLNHLLDALTATPATKDFTFNGYTIHDNTDAACGTQMALSCVPTVTDAAHYVFEDMVHPTVQTHHLLANYIAQQLLAHNFPS